MGLTYDGITYRSLEEQVRYDAEQVQLLKQADVTINENLQTVNESLQTVNTEVNGKLNKPTNPSAESAVTMLADGTVGTKQLSEIGGKLYLHKINLKTNAPEGFVIMFSITLNTSTLLTYDRLVEIAKLVSCYIMSTDGMTNTVGNIIGFYYSNNVFTASIVYNNTSVEYGAQLLDSPQDTVIEL